MYHARWQIWGKALKGYRTVNIHRVLCRLLRAHVRARGDSYTGFINDILTAALRDHHQASQHCNNCKRRRKPCKECPLAALPHIHHLLQKDHNNAAAKK